MATLNAPKVSFGENLQRLMSRRKINDVELAQMVGVSHTAIGNYKRGRVPKAATLQRLAVFFDVPMDRLLETYLSEEEIVPRPPTPRASRITSTAGLDEPAIAKQLSGVRPSSTDGERASGTGDVAPQGSDKLLQVSADFLRIDHLRTTAGLTWDQVSKELGLSVGMLMMVKTAKRRMSMKSHNRLTDVEKKFGIQAYESLSMNELRKRPADTNSGTTADFLRLDELPRYIANLEANLADAREELSRAQHEVDQFEQWIRLAKMVFAQKRRNQKNLSPNVASHVSPSASQQDMFDAFPEFQVMLNEAQDEAAWERQLAEEARKEAEALRAQNDAFESQVAEYLAQKEAWEEQIRIEKEAFDRHNDEQVAQWEASQQSAASSSADAKSDATTPAPTPSPNLKALEDRLKKRVRKKELAQKS